jgi:hypothetical protein
VKYGGMQNTRAALAGSMNLGNFRAHAQLAGPTQGTSMSFRMGHEVAADECTAKNLNVDHG